MKRRDSLKLLGYMSFFPFLNYTVKGSNSGKNIESNLINKVYNIVIYGATPGGIACAVRSAREGLQVMIVNYNQHLGGQFVNGIGTMDTLYNGARAPIYDELRYSIYDYYRSAYGYDSPQYQAANPGNPKTRFESHVAEGLINDMLGRESRISIIKGYYPVQVKKNNNILSMVTFREMHGERTISLHSEIFADCSYEGDLAALAGVEYRIGRESQEEYGEENAGVSYYQDDYWPPPEGITNQQNFKLARSLNIVQYEAWSDRMPESTGVADEAIMAYNIRTTLTDDPTNKIIPGKPENYDPEYFRKKYSYQVNPGLTVPNQKTSCNEPRLVGLPNRFVLGDWAERERIVEKFRELTLGLLYFKQNDPSVHEQERKKWKQYGLPKDEYQDNGHLPYELYVREARRIVGRSVFTEHNGRLAESLKRAPIRHDSISITEWFLDSHFCTETQIEGSKMEGEVMMKNKTFPGQVSFGTVFSKDIDNLIVPVCLSASHIGWGTIRLEPTWMSIGEAAGYIVSLAAKENISPAKIDTDKLMRLLAEKRIMITFFNDMEGRESAPWYPAVQYLGTQGFFGSYDALPNEKLSINLANAWIDYISRWLKNRTSDPTSNAKDILTAEQKGGEAIDAGAFAHRLGKVLITNGDNPVDLIQLMKRLNIYPDSLITRGDACRLIFEATA